MASLVGPDEFLADRQRTSDLGASFAEMTFIGAVLARRVLVGPGLLFLGTPYVHFGAVSKKGPEEELYRDRCLKLSQNITTKALELFGHT